MISTTAQFHEQIKTVVGLAPITPSTSVPDYVSLKNYSKLTVQIFIDNGATVTGSAITLKQAQAVANTGEKALAFDTVYANIDVANTDALTATAVASNTFTTLNTDNLNLHYQIEVDPATLDVANGFDCVRVGTGNAVNAVTCVVYQLWPAKYGKASPPSAITD